MDTPKTRRQFLADGVIAAVAAATAGRSAALAWPAQAAESETAAAMPMIALGSLRVSRVFLGSNPFFGFSHGNPQASDREMREWYTPERIMAVLDAAAELGINAVWSPCYDHWIRVWNQYREKNGKLRHWIAQPDREPMEQELEVAFNNGASAVCIQGIRIDEQVGRGRWDIVRGWLERIKAQGLPAGMATHGAKTHLEAEDRRLPTDFYHQTMYRPDNYVEQGLEESLTTIEKLDKPVVGYKVLGAGRVRPQEALPRVFKRMKAKDGVCVGVFPKKNPDEIRQNVELVRRLSS